MSVNWDSALGALLTDTERIADALERIADALEVQQDADAWDYFPAEHGGSISNARKNGWKVYKIGSDIVWMRRPRHMADEDTAT